MPSEPQLLTDRPKAERFALLVEIPPGIVPPIQRLRGLLKLALRAWGVRCVECREVRDADA